ncbi:MAG TPA: hypothetical protein PLL69_10250 [Gemmatimonadales bacterium]|nr:hypothetical protein [Gemmatimonadales bacterium]
MEELSGPVILAILYGLFSLIGGIANRNKKQQRQAPRPPVQPRPARTKPTTFDELLEEMRRQAEGPVVVEAPRTTLPAPWELEEEEEIEERETLEVEPVVISLETEPVREPPVRRTSLDQLSQEVVERRRLEAAARDRAWRMADHREFDRRIRSEDAEDGPDRGKVPQIPLRQAVIWQEILSPPVAMRQ